MSSLGTPFSPPSAAPSPSAYARALTAVPLLTADEEVALAQTYGAGRAARARLESGGTAPDERVVLLETVARGSGARAHLVLANVRLVVAFARRLDGCGVPFADLVQEGVVGLMRAVDGFDPARGFRFSTYAASWVKRHIADAAGARRAVRLPPKAEVQALACRDAAEVLLRESGRAPSARAVAARVGIPETRVERLLAADAAPVPLDALDGECGGEPGERVDPRVRWAVREALAVLPAGEREVVERRFGIDGGGARSVRAVALELGCGPEVVRAQERRALQTLRAHPAVGIVAP